MPSSWNRQIELHSRELPKTLSQGASLLRGETKEVNYQGKVTQGKKCYKLDNIVGMQKFASGEFSVSCEKTAKRERPSL